MIVDLFSHKIHSSGDEWPEKLSEIATIFGEFDGKLYDRNAFENRLLKISPRVSYLAKDASAQPRTQGGRFDPAKFRDEISAYPAYLGLYFLERSSAGWTVRISETAKRFLLREEPDVASFLRLQLPLFQYPNAMGAAYSSFTNRLRLQANTKNRTLEFIKRGIHFSPVRLIATALKVDAALRECNLLDACISFDEIFGLANSANVNKAALPSLKNIKKDLIAIREGRLTFPRKYESRFHTLRHMEMFELSHGSVKLRRGVNKADEEQLVNRLEAICSISAQFNDFDKCSSTKDIEEVIASGAWGRFFDGVKMLPAETVELLATDSALELGARQEMPAEIALQPTPEVYPLRERMDYPPPIRPYDRRREMADPEATRIKKQRRNLAHKELIDKMDNWLRELGAKPKENDHIDLFAKIPRDGSFIFEMKSGGDSLLDQIRKGLSQLYEYRYRYKTAIDDEHISLCLVLPENPSSIPWVAEYLCKDRQINICWFEKDGPLAWPDMCSEQMAVLQARN